MNIASVCIHYPSATDPVRGIFVQHRLRALAQLANVSVISPRPWFPVIRPAEAIQEIDTEIPPVSRPKMFYLPGVLKGRDSDWLRRVLVPELRMLQRDKGLDLIDAHFEYPEAVGAVRAGQELGLPVFVTVRGLLKKYLALPSHRDQIIQSLHQATGIIAVSQSLRREVLDCGIDSSKVAVIPNAVDTTQFHPRPRHELRLKLGIAKDEKLIVSVGNIEPRKGFAVLIRAMKMLIKSECQATLVILGKTSFDSNHYQQLQLLVNREGLLKHCRFIGQQPIAVVAEWLCAADVFALATAHEGCCNSVLEALATGTPVVTTNAGDNSVYVRDGHDGLLVASRDASNFAAALANALNTTWQHDEISQRIRNRSWADVAHEVLEFFQQHMQSQTQLRTTSSRELPSCVVGCS